MKKHVAVNMVGIIKNTKSYVRFMHRVEREYIIFGGVTARPRYRADDIGDTLLHGSPLAQLMHIYALAYDWQINSAE